LLTVPEPGAVDLRKQAMAATVSAEEDGAKARAPAARPSPAKPTRFAVLDVARGVALVAMVVFHCAFDLDTLGLAPVDIDGVFWRSFAKLIAGSFLFISGISLVIAHREALRLDAFLRRLAILAGAAALVTLATWYAMPDAFIFFGILHSIAVASLIGVAFLRAPALVTLAAAGLAFALPNLVSAPVLDAPGLTWLGLGREHPPTLDFEPVLPWAAPFLVGMAVAQLALARFAATDLAAWRPAALPGRALAFAGRHSLVIYLLHQPIMYGSLFLVAQGLAAARAPSVSTEDRPFVEACRKAWVDHGNPERTSLAYCTCTADELKKAGLWENVLADRYTPEVRQRLAVAMQACAPPRPEEAK
jgi:uncharacterized membrane protein